jgi:hypothetical protein
MEKNRVPNIFLSMGSTAATGCLDRSLAYPFAGYGRWNYGRTPDRSCSTDVDDFAGAMGTVTSQALHAAFEFG